MKHCIELSLREPSGVPRQQYPVTCGVPFPQGMLADVDAIRLMDKNSELPLQAARTCAWQDGSVRWALLDFQVDVSPTEERKLQLQFGADVCRSAEPDNTVRIAKPEDEVRLETSSIAVSFKGGGRLPFEQIWFRGHPVLFSDDAILSVRVDGKNYRAQGGDSTVEVEESGPLRAVVAIQGAFIAEDGSTTSLDVAARICVYAGLPYLRIYLTLTNRVPQPLVHLEQATLKLQLADIDGDGFILGSAGHYGKFTVHRAKEGRVSLRCSTESVPDKAVRRAATEYTVITGEDAPTQHPGPSWHAPLLGCATVLSRKEFHTTLALRHIWHNAPKELSVTPDGMQLELYPEWESPLEFYRGVAKTHELCLSFGEGTPDELKTKLTAVAFQEPMGAMVSTPQWIEESGAFGRLFRYQPEKYPWFEFLFRRLQEKWCWRPDQYRIGEHQLGTTMLDFGDHWLPRRNGQWENNEMDYGYALMLQTLRTAYPVPLPIIEQVIHHQIDVDTRHDSSREWEIGGQCYHFAKHGWPAGIALCHEWLEGPLFFYLVTGYRRALEVALARAEHFCKAVDAGVHRQKTIARVSGYPLMALSTIYEHFPERKYLRACEKILDWLEEWVADEGGLVWNTFGPERVDNAEGILGRGVICQGLMRYHRLTKSARAWKLLTDAIEHALATGLFTREGFAVKMSSLRRNYYAPGESDFILEPLAYIAMERNLSKECEKNKNQEYLRLGYLNLKLAVIQRNAVHGPGHPTTEEYRFWLPFLDYLDRAGILEDLKLC